MRIKLDHPYTATELCRLLGVYSRAAGTATHLSTDSREIQKGDLFVALRGDRYNGNRYIKEALSHGAVMVLSEEMGEREDVIAVKDTMEALITLARAARARLSPTVIALTGSVGKTTTKDMLAAVLSQKFRVHKTKENQNNLLGVILTLLSMPQDTEILVLELGMNHAREIATLSCLARPDFALITNVGNAHIGNLGSRAAIARAKLEILEGCEPATPYLFPACEPLLAPPCHATTLPVAIGDREGFDAAYLNVREEGGHTVADFLCGRRLYRDVHLAGRGAHVAACAAFAVFLGDLFGVCEAGIRTALRSTVSRGRMECFTENGIHFINDCYNASPESVTAALRVLGSATKEGGRRIAVLGDMQELGRETRVLHEQVGRQAAEAKLDLLFTFGAAAESIADGASEAGMSPERIFRNPDPTAHEKTGEALFFHLCEGDTVLIKASRGMTAERILEYCRTQFPCKEKECR